MTLHRRRHRRRRRRHRRRRHGRSDENINLHIIKAAAIKAIEIMQIIRKRWCRGNFCRHLKSFRRLSPMNIEQPRTCRPSPPPLSNLSSPLHPSGPSLSFRNDFEHELVHHRRTPVQNNARDESGDCESAARNERREGGEEHQNYLLKITLSRRRRYSVRDRDLPSFNFTPKRILMHAARSPGAPIGAQLKIIDDDNEPMLWAAGDRTGN